MKNSVSSKKLLVRRQIDGAETLPSPKVAW